MTIIKRGAEAVITIKADSVRKERVKKNYRVDELDDELRSVRTKREAKLMSFAKRAGVPTPLMTEVDVVNGIIRMSNVKGDKLKDVLNNMEGEKRLDVCKIIGQQIGKLHKHHIIHGDLTTSNMILAGGRVIFIDFGLGEINESIESKGVDLLLFKKALHSTHWKVAEICFSEAVETYEKSYNRTEEVLERLKTIERRGRYFSER
jgi:Kae1-associated kinase Bud32